jgi:hypothetical protein
MCGYNGNNWNYRKSNRRLKENLEAIPGKHSANSLRQTATLETSHIIRKVRIAVRNLKPECWGSALVHEEKYRGEKACDKRQQQKQKNKNYSIIIIIIIIILQYISMSNVCIRTLHKST